MKWCFLVDNAQFLSEFYSKLAVQVLKEGDECVVIFSGKITEYNKKDLFPQGIKFYSVVDWFFDHYDKSKEDFFGLSWKDFFSLFYRNKWGTITYEKAIGTIQQHIQFFKFIFEIEKIDILITEAPSGLFHLIAYHFAKIHHVPYLGTEVSKLEGQIDIYDAGFSSSHYKKTFDDLKSDDMRLEEKKYAQNFVKQFLAHDISPDATYLDRMTLSQVGIIKHYISRLKEEAAPLYKYFVERKKFREFDCESETILKAGLLAPFRMEQRQLKIALQKNAYSPLPGNNEKFFLYPLHFQPESTTLVFATYYDDQINTVKNIAFSLPVPYKLYVKEHPASIGRRPRGFYKKIKNLPNVVLLGPGENPQELIQKSSGVVVLNGTMGMKAALQGKPTYVFGEVYYSYHPLCRNVKNFDDLRERIANDLHNDSNVDLEDINSRFITAYLRNSIKGDILLASFKHDTNNYKDIIGDLRNMTFKK